MRSAAIWKWRKSRPRHQLDGRLEIAFASLARRPQLVDRAPVRNTPRSRVRVAVLDRKPQEGVRRESRLGPSRKEDSRRGLRLARRLSCRRVRPRACHPPIRHERRSRSRRHVRFGMCPRLGVGVHKSASPDSRVGVHNVSAPPAFGAAAAVSNTMTAKYLAVRGAPANVRGRTVARFRRGCGKSTLLSNSS